MLFIVYGNKFVYDEKHVHDERVKFPFLQFSFIMLDELGVEILVKKHLYYLFF